jgi:hypothetical protein
MDFFNNFFAFVILLALWYLYGEYFEDSPWPWPSSSIKPSSSSIRPVLTEVEVNSLYDSLEYASTSCFLERGDTCTVSTSEETLKEIEAWLEFRRFSEESCKNKIRTFARSTFQSWSETLAEGIQNKSQHLCDFRKDLACSSEGKCTPCTDMEVWGRSDGQNFRDICNILLTKESEIIEATKGVKLKTISRTEVDDLYQLYEEYNSPLLVGKESECNSSPKETFYFVQAWINFRTKVTVLEQKEKIRNFSSKNKYSSMRDQLKEGIERNKGKYCDFMDNLVCLWNKCKPCTDLDAWKNDEEFGVACNYVMTNAAGISHAAKVGETIKGIRSGGTSGINGNVIVL